MIAKIILAARLCAASTLALACLAAPALAAKASFGIPPAATSAGVGGTSISQGTVNLGPSGTNGFITNFVLPNDYEAGRPVKVTFYAHTSAAGCFARMIVTNVNRKRLGKPVSSGLSGVTGVKGTPLLALPDTAFRAIVVRIGPGNGLNGQKAGDAFTISMQREGSAPSDTCDAWVYIHAIKVVYPTK